MRETGSLGVRHLPVGRIVAERRIVEVELPYGRCRVKVGTLDGEEFVASPEYSDAARLAEKTGSPAATSLLGRSRRIQNEEWRIMNWRFAKR